MQSIKKLVGFFVLFIYTYTMSKTALLLASFFAMTAVILGAFGAHGLRNLLEPSQILAFKTAVQYQFYHAIALFITGILLQLDIANKGHKLLKTAIWCFTIGIILFSGSLYLLACREVLGIENWSFLGPITPLGGLAFILGWLCVLIRQIRR